jgi:hypothetical protein
VPAVFALVVSLILPSPENITVFLGALGFGLGIGVGAYIERVGRARVKAFKEYDAAFKESSLARAREAERLRDEMFNQVQSNSAQILKLKEELAEKTHTAEEALLRLAEMSVQILTDFGYVRNPERNGNGPDAPH